MPGWPLAHRTLHFYLAAMLHAFEWECAPEILENMEEKVGRTIQRDKRVRLSTSVYM